jgi:hypothetical protein
MLLHNNNSKTDKTQLLSKKTWNSYRKISVSDQHLEYRNNPDIVPRFLQLSSTSCYREGSSSKRSEINGSGFSQGGRLGGRRMSLGSVLERRDRKNGVAALSKYDR